MYISTRLDNWLMETVSSSLTDPAGRQYDLILLAGNAGDGKSALIRQIYRQLSKEFPDIDEHLIANWDATHSDSPDQSQVGLLAEFFAPFSDDAVGRPEKLHMVAMNTGMILGFFATYEELLARKGAVNGAGSSLSGAAGAILGELGISWDGSEPDPSLTDHILVVNLDERSLVNFDGSAPSLLSEMLDKLDPTNEAGLTHETVNAFCRSCPVQQSCFLYYNLTRLTSPRTSRSLEGIVKRIHLEGEIHLSPRNMWDFLFHLVAADGEEMVSQRNSNNDGCPLVPIVTDMIESRTGDDHPVEGGEDDGKNVNSHRELASRLFFMYPYENTHKIPLFAAISKFDPVQYHSAALDISSLEAGLNPRGHPVSQHASLAADCLTALTRGGTEDGMGPAAFVKRWTFFLSTDTQMHKAFEYDLLQPQEEFIQLALAYRDFLDNPVDRRSGAKLVRLADSIKKALRQSFGDPTRDDMYSVRFHEDLAFKPLVKVPEFQLRPVSTPPGISKQYHRSLLALDWFPREIPLEVSTSARAGEANDSGPTIYIDFGLFTLLRQISRGYNPSSFDLNRFYQFKSLGEQIGAHGLEAGQILEISFVGEDGHTIIVREEPHIPDLYDVEA